MTVGRYDLRAGDSRPDDLNAPVAPDLVTFYHSSIRSLIKYGALRPDEYKRRVSFAMIRNPWERLVSMAAFGARKWGRTVERQMKLYRARIRSGKRYIVGWDSHRRINPQCDWLAGDSGFHVDLIGQYEFLEDHLAAIADRLGWPAPDLPRVNESGPHECYRDYYDRKTRRLVGEWFAADVALGRYHFSRPSGHGYLMAK